MTSSPRVTTGCSHDAGWHPRAVALNWGIFSQHFWGEFTQPLHRSEEPDATPQEARPENPAEKRARLRQEMEDARARQRRERDRGYERD